MLEQHLRVVSEVQIIRISLSLSFLNTKTEHFPPPINQTVLQYSIGIYGLVYGIFDIRGLLA